MMGEPISPAGSKANPAAFGSAVLEATARARSSAGARADPKAKRPDIVLSFLPLYYAPKSAPLQYSLQGEEWPLQTNAYTILATLGETKAQGSVTFPSGAPDVSPVVTHHAMTDPEDLERAREAVKLARQIGGAAEFSQPSAAIENGAGDANMWTAVYDGRGTCRMGRSHHNSVVDHKLRVHGITGLRVVDGSVIPVGSPYLAVPEVLALAERASELILDQHLGSKAAAAAVSVADLPEERVTIADLSEKLGARFSMMRAVAYLSATQSEGLSGVPAMVLGSTSPPAAFMLATGVCMLLAATTLALSRNRKARESRQSNYAALLA